MNYFDSRPLQKGWLMKHHQVDFSLCCVSVWERKREIERVGIVCVEKCGGGGDWEWENDCVRVSDCLIQYSFAYFSNIFLIYLLWIIMHTIEQVLKYNSNLQIRPFKITLKVSILLQKHIDIMAIFIFM